MKLSTFVIAAASAAVASAACPNQCSGHGECTQNDKCVCYANWQGSDCSLRTCDFGRAWAVDESDPHAYAECSGQGMCNRATGDCECFDGFTGRACARSACPGDCSGNGVCKLLSEIETSVPYDVNSWDAQRIQACVCDPGFFGPDCSQRYCPTGDDPLTLCSSTQKGQVQEVRFTLGSTTKYDFNGNTYGSYTTGDEELALWGHDGSHTAASARESASGQLRLRYVSSSGGAYTAHGIPYVLSASDSKARDHFEIALETLPEQKVADADVETKMTATGVAKGSGLDNVIQRAYQVTFMPDETNSINVGLQNNLQCDTGYSCTDAGCQPMVKMPFLYRYAGSVETTTGTGLTPTAGIQFFSGGANTDADFNAKKFVRLSAGSQPQLPQGVAVDAKVSAANPSRYDMRILLAVQDADSSDGIDNNDLLYAKVVVGHDNITSASEAIGYAAGTRGVWGAGKTFTAGLEGFTFLGPIPNNPTGISIPGAPGVMVDLPAQNIVGDNKMRFYEIVVKLPHCSVTPLLKAGDLKDLSSGADLTPVDVNVENMECSGRGMCNRATGECACFEGYYSPACNRQTTLV